MKSRLVSAAFAFVLGFSTAIGQTAKDIEAKYGKPENVYPLSGKVYYSMSEHVLMRPVYGADGQVCLMQLYPKGIHPDESHPDDALAVDEVLKIINELFPPGTR